MLASFGRLNRDIICEREPSPTSRRPCTSSPATPSQKGGRREDRPRARPTNSRSNRIYLRRSPAGPRPKNSRSLARGRQERDRQPCFRISVGHPELERIPVQPLRNGKCLTDAAFLRSAPSLPLGSLSWARRLRAQAAETAKKPPRIFPIIHLWLAGRIQPTRYLRPEARLRPKYRGAFKPIRTNGPGACKISEHLPLTANR